MAEVHCKFCSGDKIPAQYVGEGIKTMGFMLNTLLGGDIKDGIHLEDGNKLVWDNSSGEYAELSTEISFCPFCGVRLSKCP